MDLMEKRRPRPAQKDTQKEFPSKGVKLPNEEPDKWIGVETTHLSANLYSTGVGGGKGTERRAIILSKGGRNRQTFSANCFQQYSHPAAR